MHYTFYTHTFFYIILHIHVDTEECVKITDRETFRKTFFVAKQLGLYDKRRLYKWW